MKHIRLANINYLVSRPFRLLKQLDFCTYEENSPGECARRLHEGEVDVALIPAVDFGVHGGYVGLDYGVACPDRSDCVMLYANQEIRKLQTIYLYDCSSASALLLKLLLKEKWLSTPRLVNVTRQVAATDLEENAGVLIRHEAPQVWSSGFRYAEDLGTVWHNLTGLPFVFFVWATRPGTLSLAQHRALNEIFCQCSTARSTIAEEYAAEFSLPVGTGHTLLRDHHVYYLDRPMIEGLNTFFSRARKLNLLPVTTYQSATFTLLNKRTTRVTKSPTVSQLLQNVVRGSRIGIKDGVRLAEEASLSDLGLVADQLRKRNFNDRSVSYIYAPPPEVLADFDRLDETTTAAISRGINHVLIDPPDGALNEFSHYLNLIHALKAQRAISVEGFKVSQLLAFSVQTGLRIRDIVSRLVTAGLDAVTAEGGGMLIDRIMAEEGEYLFTARDWLNTMKWVHQFGARSSCALDLRPGQSWEERLIHLHKVRTLQDQNPGCRYFHCQAGPDFPDCDSAEIKLRATIIGRIFLDNVPSVREIKLLEEGLHGVLGLCFGVNDVALLVHDLDNLNEHLATIRVLRETGVDFEASPALLRSNPEVH